MIKPTLLAVADYANTGESGKLNIMGIFDVIYSQSFPTRHHQLFLVSRFIADPDESGNKYNFTFRLAYIDSLEEIVSVAVEITIGESNQGAFIPFNYLIQGRSIEFKYPGTYLFSVKMNDQLIGEIPITIIQGTP